MRSNLLGTVPVDFDLSESLKSWGRAAVTAMLVALLAGQPVMAQAAVAKKPLPAAALAADTPQQRALHVLNRFTFGPRPGDLALVEKMGVSRWFDLQLKPGSIDDSALDGRLQQYPATLMPLDVVERRYPSPAILKQIEAGRVPMPSDPDARAMVNDQLAFYNMAQELKKAAPAVNVAAPAAKAMASDGTGGELMSDGTMAAAPGSSPTAATPAPSPKQRRRQVRAGMAAVDDAAGDGSMQNGMAPDKPLAAADVSANGAAIPVPSSQRLSPEQLQGLLAQAPDQRYQAILAMPPQQLVRLRGSLQGPQMLRLTEDMTPQQRETLAALPGSLRMVALESMESRLDRDIYSNRQLEAVMTDFWLNHFNVYVRKNQNEPYLLATYERETIRPHALGKFEDLLVATAESPAMLEYLDNFRSVGPDSRAASRVKQVQQRNPNGPLAKAASAGLNENYGRELMELHTLGVNGGYTQADVTQVSKVFTGWTLDRPNQGGGFVFMPNRHEPGDKIVLGKTIHENGMNEGLEVLHMLATSPATANFLCGKLAVRFVSDTPPQALVDRMAAAYLKSDGDIRVVLRTMFDSPEFWSPQVYRAKVKTPLEFVVSAVRAGDINVGSTQALVQSLDKLGMPLYGMPTPNGYSWKQDEWVSTGALVSRMNFALVLSGGRMPGTRTEWTQLLEEPRPVPRRQAGVVPASYKAGAAPEAPLGQTPLGQSPLDKEHRLEMILMGQPVSDRTRSTVLAQDDDADVTAQAATQFDLGGQGGKGNYAARGLRQLGREDRSREDRGPDDPQAAVMAGLLIGSPEFQRR